MEAVPCLGRTGVGIEIGAGLNGTFPSHQIGCQFFIATTPNPLLKPLIFTKHGGLL